MNFPRLNLIVGWSVFSIATLVYLLTMESTASLWDCGEYITAAYKLEVGHPPGAPLFMVLGRLFSFFAAPDSVALWINALSALSSSFTILFMFWSLTLMLRKLVAQQKNEVNSADGIMILVASTVASLAYTFSDSFWFSAVEGEVYAMASLFTAIIFWAALKWDEEMRITQESSTAAPNRWILFIFFMLGLAVGVHLLGILVVPAIGYIIYFNVVDKFTWKGFFITGIISVFTLGFIQEGIIPGSIAIANKLEVGFVNSLGLPFNSGTVFFFLLLIGLCVFAVRYARRTKKTLFYNAVMGITLLLIGYGSFAVIVIRSNANTPLDENDPENLVTLHSYLKREQYGSNPILSGPYWNSYRLNEVLVDNSTCKTQLTSREGWGDLSPYYLRRFVVQEGENDVKAFVNESDAQAWVKNNRGAYTITEKYYESNTSIRIGAEPAYEQTTFFPRMYDANDPNKIEGYKSWSGYDPNDGANEEIGRDCLRLPTMSENLTYFFRYQVDWMYVRYLLWNFAGRQNDIQGNGDNLRGNWISGIETLDAPRVGPSDSQPYFTTENAAHNRFFLIPLALILLGIFFHFYRAPKDAFVLLLAFLFTGIAILVYLNQKPFEPRERDYAYSGSFYFFSMWMAFGVYALYDFVTNLDKKALLKLGYFLGGGLVVCLALGYGGAWLFSALIIALMIGISYGLGRMKQPKLSLGVISVIGMIAPLLMGFQGWDDHDRSGKTSARDLAYNYLNSCKKNGILFTNGDNDTFPLWYLQEVEGKRTDVRVCNLSLMGTDWYTNQMKLKAYESDALPIKFREDQILMYSGNTDQVYFISLAEMASMGAPDDLMKRVINLRLKTNRTKAAQTVAYFNANLNLLRSAFTASKPESQAALNKTLNMLSSADTSNLTNTLLEKFRGINLLFDRIRSGDITLDQNSAQKVQQLISDLEKPWSTVDLTEAMAFVRDDNNHIVSEDGNTTSFFPSNTFSLKVNKKNLVASGVVDQKELDRCANEIVFAFKEEQDPYLTRDEVMMMEVVANNDWKRGIYFSSNRGSSFSLALLSYGWIKQVGMAYVLTPLDAMRNGQPNFYHLREMYKNITSVYQYGDMANPNVLTDYYARRHTQQFRANFLLLAEQLYLDNNRSKAIKVLDQSLAVMPAEHVIDMGEVHGCDPMNMLSYNAKNQSYSYMDQQVRAKCSGNLNEHVQLYYLCKANSKGEKLGNIVLDQYESILKFYQNTSASICTKLDNSGELFAVADGLFKMYSTLQDSTVNMADSKFGKRLMKDIQLIYKTILPKLSAELIRLGNENGEPVASDVGNYSQQYGSLNQNLEAIGQHYGYLKRPALPTKLTNESPSNLPMLPGQ
jgi:hypothetical protein